MTKSELIARLSKQQDLISDLDVELAVNAILEHITTALTNGERIEVRGFGVFILHHRPARTGRNPKTGEAVDVAETYIPHFKPGKELARRVNTTATRRRS